MLTTTITNHLGTTHFSIEQQPVLAGPATGPAFCYVLYMADTTKGPKSLINRFLTPEMAMAQAEYLAGDHADLFWIGDDQ